MRYWEQPNQPYQEPVFHHSVGSRRPSPAVKWILILTIAAYLIELLVFSAARSGAATGAEARDSFYRALGWFILQPTDVFRKGCVWQLVTYAFLHDPTDIFHIFFNMLCLYFFGRDLEAVWGTRRFAAFYLASAAFAGLVFSLVHVLRPLTRCLGASGAIMAVLMAYALHWPHRRVLFMLFFPIRIRTLIIILIIIQVLGLLRQHGDVAYMAHLGGLLYGYLYVRAAPPLAAFLRGFLTSPPLNRSAAAHPEADDRRLDEILARIHREGINALTPAEKRFLDKMSQRR